MPRSSIFSTRRTRRRRWLIISIPLPSFAWISHVRSHLTSYTVSSLLLLGGFVGITYVLLQPVVSSSTPSTPVGAMTPAVQAAEPKQSTSLPRSTPTYLEIPDIAVATDLLEVGKNADGTLQVPEDDTKAGWYRYSPTPGEIGPAIISGHVDNYLGPAVFFRLKDMQPGQSIYITRQDDTTVHFKVDRVEVFEQDNFPTAAVYGNIDHSGLRLITCEGAYDVLTNHYSHNVVVFASYVDS